MASLPLFNCSSCHDDHHLHHTQSSTLLCSPNKLRPHLSLRKPHSLPISRSLHGIHLSRALAARNARQILCRSSSNVSSLEKYSVILCFLIFLISFCIDYDVLWLEMLQKVLRDAKKADTRNHSRGKVQLCIKLVHQVEFGDHVGILGSSKELGSWKKNVMMTWTEDGWVSELELKGANDLEYKFVIVTKDNKLVWEEGDNRALKLPKDGSFEIVCHWNKTQESANLLQLDPVGIVDENELDAGDGPAVAAPVLEGEPSPFVQEWQGRAVAFMQSNEHRNREMERMWNTEGLEGLSRKLVQGDQNARNWRRKDAILDCHDFFLVLGFLTGVSLLIAMKLLLVSAFVLQHL
ncbi:hypothetical protein ACLOJK_024206 [Asimina triloba]